MLGASVSKHFSILIFLPNCFLILVRITILKAMLIHILYFKTEPLMVKAQSFYRFKSNSDPDHDGGGQIIQCFANAHCHDIA
jgi:hypothetical protein